MELANGKNKKEVAKKRRAFYSVLQQEIENNNKYADAMKEAAYDTANGITPVPPPQRTNQEEKADVVKQRQTAFAALKTIMTAYYANRFLDRLANPEYFEFNSLWGVVKKKLEGRTNMDDAFLYAFWVRLRNRERRRYGGAAPVPPPLTPPPTPPGGGRCTTCR